MRAKQAIFVMVAGGRRYALRLSQVERVLRAARLAPLGQPGGLVAGVLNLHGRALSVVDIRPPAEKAELRLSDCFVIAGRRGRRVAIWVEQAIGVVEAPVRDWLQVQQEFPAGRFTVAAAAMADGELVFLLDLAALMAAAGGRPAARASGGGAR